MDFRYQEVLTWIVPGFYLIAYVFGVAWLIIPDDMGVNVVSYWFNKLVTGGDSQMALMLFAVPILSLIVGWIVNCYGGLLFRRIFKGPIVKAYIKVTDDNFATEKKAEEEFDKVREYIDLDKVDRFYYRYVFSRNMFTAQVILILMMFFIWVAIGIRAMFGARIVEEMELLIIFIATIVFCTIYIPCIVRDLYTHSKYVFLAGVKEKVIGIPNRNLQNTDNQ